MDRLKAMALFVDVARARSFTAAARAKNLSPSSVSRQITELEAGLGTQLLYRSTRFVDLTEAGALYFARVAQVLEDIADADAAATALQAAPTGTLHVHSRYLFGLVVLAPLLPQFQALYPEIMLELSLSERSSRLRDDAFDVDLRFRTPPDPGLVQDLVLPSERILVASPAYLEAGPSPVRPADLHAHRCLGYLMGREPIVWRFMHGAAYEELTIDTALKVDSGELLRRLVLGGHGIALLDDFTVRREMDEGRLVRLLADHRVTNTTFEGGVFAAYRETTYTPLKIKVFVDFLKERLAPSAAQAPA
ncbi:LysR family transcriptional regulator [Acuticoccus sediminis]|uniref:LysR family transcriptional regulator n=1 Tax=Acuticoccus sediminis TaxID=2184697 RepID=A0A8B2NU16_9HYPH|nr:LysR family transcriptional regulator [Acuticoccus sediminis]RAI02461.1 LysR family transcriptional regulator [Acuticoccus sediminis]